MSLTVVVAGNMNPAIHHPLWYVAGGAITQSEAEAAAATALLVPQLAQFATPRWRIACTPERWTATSLVPESSAEVLALASRTFERLGETPISAFGLNYDQTGALSQREAASAFMLGLGLGEYKVRQIAFGREAKDLRVGLVSLARSVNILLELKPDSAAVVHSNVHHEIVLDTPGFFDFGPLIQAAHSEALGIVGQLSSTILKDG